MNERIKYLILEAGFPKFDKMYVVSDGVELEKFANLIVQDVLNLLGDEVLSLHYLEQPCCEDAVFLLQSKIKDHFYEKPYAPPV